ncbi:uncharacterized protein LOC115757713 isoform X3 [Drosophila novamexicana]|uniref:uncharacterized protein LOC115757713 isoform X3 n=2 Tax=Drosophila novamexicana TaxID=47314 RepID=UPI0011E5EA21|nr:uncharacterized protein LOC115757713 isoform X3 [Drosophila novamexicana]
MDTAAAAAAAVVVDLSGESVGKSTASKLISKPNPKPKPTSGYVAAAAAAATTPTPCSVGSEHDATNCLGSTVESMSATPPLTPRRTRVICHETGDSSAGGTANGESHARAKVMNGLKDLAGECSHAESITPARAPLMPATLTSSTNASTTPMSALLTAPATTTTTTTAAATTTHTTTAAASTTSTTTTTAATGSSGSSGTTSTSANMDQLLHWQDMPKYLQFNPYVLKGYRPLQTFKGCLLSLFYWHNETINILTHAIPIFYILAIVPGLMPWDSGYKFLSFCHVFGSVAPWCGSFVYHLFMNIEKGENVYYTLLKLDMVGIWVSQSFGTDRQLTVAEAPLLRAALCHALRADLSAHPRDGGWQSHGPFPCLPAGWRFHIRRRYWCHAHTRKVVPGSGRLLSELAQHYACAGRGGCVLHAQGHNQGL